MGKKILILQGNRQTGQLLLGRLDKLKKAVSRDLNWEMIAPDAPHLYSTDDDDQKDEVGSGSYSSWQRTWWHRHGNVYHGLEESLSTLLDVWKQGNFIGILGFSQGSRMAHIISVLHNVTGGSAFSGLQFVVHVSGYGDCPMPDNWSTYLRNSWGDGVSHKVRERSITIPSLHVMGEQDKLIPQKSSIALMNFYVEPVCHDHPGGHHVPVKAGDVQMYLQFFKDVNTNCSMTTSNPKESFLDLIQPDAEHAQAQIDELSALSQIFPSELKLLSESALREDDFSEDSRTYQHPIRYSILLQPQDDFDEDQQSLWPKKQIALGIQYPPDYPDSSPKISLIHDMNYLEFSMQQSDALMNVLRNTMTEELGMPCVMGIVYSAREFFESGGLATAKDNKIASDANEKLDRVEDTDVTVVNTLGSTSLKPCSAKRIAECNQQGLEIAHAMLGHPHSDDVGEVNTEKSNEASGKGGSWKYTIGLVGKPSAGKSTFFNAATAFARQRGTGGGEINRDGNSENDTILYGAAMAPHPFTTIDPNVGFCLVPAPAGSCPEEEESSRAALLNNGLVLGSTHGRDSKGRRLISLCLKDVAGLVPGAYQGRGKGNKFLDDLTDADVLVQVVDASGLSDAEGNRVASDEKGSIETNHPIQDLAWVRNELVEWVFFNIASKWDNVVRRGQDKLAGMFSGYKQSQSFVFDVFAAVETYMKEEEGRDRIFNNLSQWDEGDLHRLVSAFLGMRFPMALALNKVDLPTAPPFVNDIKRQLPIHGAHVGIGLSAHKEMNFMRQHILGKKESDHQIKSFDDFPNGVWGCLQSAMSLRAPVLVFPVNDMITYEPLPGMTKYATRDASLPNKGMISCLTHAGGCSPSHWDVEKHIYTPSITKSESKPALRDVLLLKPGSTVEDVFSGLKWMGALEGEFVRAEGASKIGEKPKLVSKSDKVGKHNRILRIMTTKRRTWQK